ncbi:helix-hairpin-helix domain-containing protein [Lactobacillus equicursoris]|uniref:helix-hairpin-helix domain-containing protein n=1 Tax=Lactobacillus equicursoris TaxID=420645 RepID=UPI00399108FC
MNQENHTKSKFRQVVDWLVEKKIYLIGIVLVAGGVYFHQASQNQVDNSALLSSSQSASAGSSFYSSGTSASRVSSAGNAQTSSMQVSSNKVVCDISGAVKHQGVYTLKNGMRLEDLIECAGGLSKRADLKAINRSQLLHDQDKIYIPYKGEKNVPASSATAVSTSSSTSNNADVSAASEDSASGAGGQVNINTASATELQKLNGIGEKKAQQIIAYRQEKGGFKSIDELKEVSGIGDKTFAAIKDQLTI